MVANYEISNKPARVLRAIQKKGQGNSFRYPDPKQIKLAWDDGPMFLPKRGWLRHRNSRDVSREV